MSQPEPDPAPHRLSGLASLMVAVGLTYAAYHYHISPGQFALHSVQDVVFLEGTARVLAGDLPGHDFSSPLGPALWVLPAMFLSDGQLWFTIPTLLICVTALTTALIATTLTPSNISQFFLSVVLMLFCAAALNAPVSAWSEPDALAWFGLHARIAQTLLLVFAAWLVTQCTGLPRPLSWPGAALAGTALFLLFTIQVSYALAALVLLAVAAVRAPQNTGRIMAIFVTFLLFSTVLFPAVIIGYLADVPQSLLGLSIPSRPDMLTAATASALPLIALLSLSVMAHRAQLISTRLIVLLSTTVTLLSSIFHLIHDTFTATGPMLGVAAGLALVLAQRQGWPRFILPLVLVAASLSLDAYATANALWRNHTLAAASTTVTYNRIRVDTVDGLTAYLRSGEAALNHIKNSLPTRCQGRGFRVADTVNPLSALLARPSGPSAYLWIAPPAQEGLVTPALWADFAGDAAVVLMPKDPFSPAVTEQLKSALPTELEQMIDIHENDGWTVLADASCAR